MNKKNTVLSVTDNFPVKMYYPIHSGKVRSVYWLNKEQSNKLIELNNYDVEENTSLALMIISDRISAFDCIWKSENLEGVPHKGASLNAIAAYWFKLFKEHNIANNHIVDIAHPYLWVIKQSSVIKIEAIARKYICGSLWRDYNKGIREFCGLKIADGLKQNQELDNLLITPSTKGILRGIESVPELDDVNIDRETIIKNYKKFNLQSVSDLDKVEDLLERGFNLISNELKKINQILVDTKFEFGYSNNEIIFIDEVGTPDSSRFWDMMEYQKSNVVENSKEQLREFLMNNLDKDILLNKNRMSDRLKLAKDYKTPDEVMYNISNTYKNIAEKISKQKLSISDSPREEIIELLSKYKLLDS